VLRPVPVEAHRQGEPLPEGEETLHHRPDQEVPHCVDDHAGIALSEAVVDDIAQPGVKEGLAAGEVKDMRELGIRFIDNGEGRLCREILLGLPAGADVTGPATQIAAACDLQVQHESILLPAALQEALFHDAPRAIVIVFTKIESRLNCGILNRIRKKGQVEISIFHVFIDGAPKGGKASTEQYRRGRKRDSQN